jgi:copper chaperone NosL
MRGRAPWLPATLLFFSLACALGPRPPADLDAGGEICAWCRMAVSDPRLAAQIVAPAEEPLFFDDIGCLADHLARSGTGHAERIAYLADHRTGEWVPAAGAVLTRNASFATPMGSHLLAHADTASRDADPAAAGGVAIELARVFGPAGPPDGRAERGN